MFNWYFASGDLDFFWNEQLRALSWLPHIFQKDQGFGYNGLLSLWLDYPFRLLLKFFSTIGLSWFLIEKLLWLSVFILAIYSSYRLARYVLGKTLFIYLAPLIYTANTYILLLFSGGQLGVAWAYAFSPWVLLQFVEAIDSQKKTVWRMTIRNGLFFSLLVVFDLRLAYLTLLMIGFWLLIHALYEKKYLVNRLFEIGVSLVVAGSVHIFWILPTVLASTGVASKGETFTSPGMLAFLSFADFSHTLSFLHPNWPENLFGKV